MVLGGEKRPEDSAVGWALRPVLGGCSAGLRMIHQRWTHQGSGPVGRTCDDEYEESRPGGNWGAHGGPRWSRGMVRIRTSSP
jgi:hypothetical protein